MNKNKYKLLFTHRFWDSDISYITSKIENWYTFLLPNDFSNENLRELIKDSEVVIGEPPSKEVLDSAKKLKLIQIPWTGVDRLDFNMLKKYDFKICNSHSNANSVAELAVALLFSIIKYVPLHDKNLRKKNWMRPSPNNEYGKYIPRMMARKQVLIIGYGAVGQKIARMLSGFDVKISIINKTEPDHCQHSYFPSTEKINAAATADYIFICLPLTKETENYIDKQFYSACKKSTYIVNTSRGNICNEKDLYEALKNERIAGAAIDTWYQYPNAQNKEILPSSFPFHKLKNVVLSPHQGGFSRGELPHLDDAIKNLILYAHNKRLINVVDVNQQY